MQIQNFADRVVVDGRDYVIAYSRVSITNGGASPKTVSPGASPELVPPNEPGGAIAAAYLNWMGHAVGWPSPRWCAASCSRRSG